MSGVAHRHIELGNTRSVVAENALANGPAQLGEIGFRCALARNQNEVGRVDCTDGGKRKLFRIAAANAYEGEREHGAGRERPHLATVPRVTYAAL